MAKFFVGQRVKLVYSRGWIPAGCQGRVISITSMVDTKGGINDCLVSWDGHQGVNGAMFEQLEPILPEGHRTGETGLCEPLDRLLGRVTA